MQPPPMQPPPTMPMLPPGTHSLMGLALGHPRGMQQLQQPPPMVPPPGPPPPGMPPLSAAGALPPAAGLPCGMQQHDLNMMLAQFASTNMAQMGSSPGGMHGMGPPPGLSIPDFGMMGQALAAQQQAMAAAAGGGSNSTLAALLGEHHPPMRPPPETGSGGTGNGGGGEAEGQQQHQHQQQQQSGEKDDDGRGRRTRESRELMEMKEKLAEAEKMKSQAEKMKCHLHKKPKNGCKFCKKHQDLLDSAQKVNEKAQTRDRSRDRGRRPFKPDRAISEERNPENRRGPLELANVKSYGFSGLLQTHVVECAHFKSLLTLETFEQLVDETYQFANSVEPYMANSGTLPSALFCCLYRFFTLTLDSRQLRRLVESQESPYIRCCGFLYVRFGLPHDQILTWLAEYVLDDEEFKPSPDSELRTTIGDYVEGLLSQDRYYNTVLPRLPMVTKRAVEEKLAPLGQNRKRMKANKDIIDVFRESGTKVESNVGGEWLRGTLVELDEEMPTRPKLRVRLEDGSEEYVHLGKVILADGSRGRERDRRSGHGRSRSRSPRVDWSRDKGRSDKELVEEMRSREREKAVCTTGKDYARKPVGYKAACALPREQGSASYRLMEEETFVPMNRSKRTRTPTPERENFGRRPSAEHQARMQQLFEKYGNVKGTAEERRQDDGVDRPDVMRFG